MRVYTVEVYADAPMRVRGTFATRAEAEAFADSLGGLDACLISEAERVEECDHGTQIQKLRAERDELRAELAVTRSERDGLLADVDELRAELQDRDEKLSRIRAVAA